MNNNRLIFSIVAAVGGLVTFIATFLSFVSVSFLGESESVSLIADSGDDPLIIPGFLFLILGLVMIAGAAYFILESLGVFSLPIDIKIVKFAGVGVAAVNALLAIIQIIKTIIWMGSDDVKAIEAFGASVSYSAGFFFLIIGMLAAVAGYALLLVLDKE